MIVVLKSISEKDIEKIVSRIEDKGFKTIIQKGVEKTVINAIGLGDRDKNLLIEQLQSLDCVENVIPILKPYKIVAKECNPKGSKIKVGNISSIRKGIQTKYRHISLHQAYMHLALCINSNYQRS